jgi:hypothetical protein
VHLTEGNKNIPLLLRISWTVLIPVFLFIGIRGGFREIPITASQPYFSKHNILNIAAVNPGYNIAFNIWENSGANVYDPFFKFTDEEALQIVQKIRQVPKDTTVVITHVRRPNIVFVLLESWPADVIESLGGEPGIIERQHDLVVAFQLLVIHHVILMTAQPRFAQRLVSVVFQTNESSRQNPTSVRASLTAFSRLSRSGFWVCSMSGALLRSSPFFLKWLLGLGR